MYGWQELLSSALHILEGFLYIFRYNLISFSRETDLKVKVLVQAGSAFKNANATWKRKRTQGSRQPSIAIFVMSDARLSPYFFKNGGENGESMKDRLMLK